jgi:ribonuclease T2
MMEGMPRYLVLPWMLILAGCAASVAEKPDVKSEARTEKKQRRAQRPRGESGQFDFYVLSLSWSPGFCETPAGQRDQLQCGPSRNFAFVLHGLWPQYEKKGWPQNCAASGGPSDADVKAMLDIQPSPRLVRHEWEKHGTCSGLSAVDYLKDSREAFEKVTIPEQYRAPLRQITFDPAEMRREFGGVNPEFGEEGFVVVCTNNGRFLQEVRACLSKDLAGRRCNEETLREQCRSKQVIMRPLR